VAPGAVVFAVFFAAFAGAAFFTATFLAIFFGDAFAASARNLARRFFAASMIAFRPAADIFRFGLAGAVAGAGSAFSRTAAHLALWLSRIFRFVAAENSRRLPGVDSGVAAAFARLPGSIERISAIWASMRVLLSLEGRPIRLLKSSD
jgi:hypothetical protein